MQSYVDIIVALLETFCVEKKTDAKQKNCFKFYRRFKNDKSNSILYRRFPKVTSPFENNGSPKITLVFTFLLNPKHNGPTERNGPPESFGPLKKSLKEKLSVL